MCSATDEPPNHGALETGLRYTIMTMLEWILSQGVSPLDMRCSDGLIDNKGIMSFGRTGPAFAQDLAYRVYPGMGTVHRSSPDSRTYWKGWTYYGNPPRPGVAMSPEYRQAYMELMEVWDFIKNIKTLAE